MMHTYIWMDIGFTATLDFHEGSSVVDITVYRIRTYSGRMPLYESKDEMTEFVSELGEASVFMKGKVQWDGCSNWDFQPEDGDGLKVHFCNKKQMVNLGVMLGRLHDAGVNLINSAQLH